VRERIDAGGGHVRIGREIGRRVDAERRVPALVPAKQVVVVERVDLRGRDVGVVGEIAGGIEEEFGLRPSCQPKLLKWVSGSTPAAATSGLCCR
jgi:hypothetical protein